MKVAVVVNHTTESCRPGITDKSDLDGFENFHVFRFAVSLRDAGADVCFFYLTSGSYLRKAQKLNTPIALCPVSLMKGKYGFEFSLQLYKSLHNFRPDIIQAFNYCTPVNQILASYARLKHVPIIISNTGSNTVHYPSRKLLGKFSRAVQRRMIKLNSALNVPLNSLEKSWVIDNVGFPKERVFDIHWEGVDTSVFRPLNKHHCRMKLGLADKMRYLLAALIFRDEGFDKNPFEVIRIFKGVTVRDVNHAWKLILVGDGTPEIIRKVISEVERLDLQDRVILPGWVSDPNLLAEYYNASDVFINTSRKDVALPGELSIGKETTLCYAMACGLPAVSYHTGSPEDGCLEDGRMLYAPFNDRQAMADQIIRVCNDDKLRSLIVANALEEAKGLGSWEAIGRGFIEAYKEIISFAKK